MYRVLGPTAQQNRLFNCLTFLVWALVAIIMGRLFGGSPVFLFVLLSAVLLVSGILPLGMCLTFDSYVAVRQQRRLSSQGLQWRGDLARITTSWHEPSLLGRPYRIKLAFTRSDESEVYETVALWAHEFDLLCGPGTHEIVPGTPVRVICYRAFLMEEQRSWHVERA